ncbi:MAG TPA: 2-oxoglutarate dehydrogenase E1 component [Geothermobacteraceae bacterium]|nr:2-oxoglutarate dehydrogenase E1 component [Geothermobacteraceae bacterium]
MNINASPEWLEDQFRRWQNDPDSVPASVAAFFQGYLLGEALTAGNSGQALKQASVQSLIYRYRSLGHLQACTDPLNPCPLPLPVLSLEEFGLDKSDLDTTFYLRNFVLSEATLAEILEILQETYCRTVGIEFMHIQNQDERQWLIDQMEPVRNRPPADKKRKLAIMKKLQEAALFELFLHKKFIGQKRFSLEGGETMIPLLDATVRRAAQLGVKDLVLGMAHRGRLNVLANIFGKPYANIFAEFADNLELHFVGEGDVKYHKGFSHNWEFSNGSKIHLSIASNPSHLEAVDPVVEGKCRARHSNYGPGGKKMVLPVLIHGDAAFAGQGIVPETLNLSQLDGYQTGGTFHLVLNNQIGFTTAPEHARSTCYATDVAKMLMVPIFHVHGEDPEAAAYVAGLALDYRQRFGRDVVVEMICYRRQGHNEGDEPYFTQPLMYEKIRQRPPVHEVYAERLVAEGIDRQEIQDQATKINIALDEALQAEGEHLNVGFRGKWKNIQRDYQTLDVATGVPVKTLQKLGKKATTIPERFNPHPKIAKLLAKRQETIMAGEGIDWGTAETLAYATLLTEGAPVRISGQDSRRGTFNHRHAALVDNVNGQLYVPLAFLGPSQAPVQVYNSMLSENAVLGFEYGYSLEMPEGLTIWEAQFGDFANGAQVIIDQFISSSSSKWDRSSGLTMFLPHGYEGQGAEHSSARIERYLMLCADHNLQIINPSTPSQLFHMLRRQMKVPFRRPLIVFTPKSLLRHPECRSPLVNFAQDRFAEIIPGSEVPKRVRTLLFCSGKIYYELKARKDADSRDDVDIIRIEQLYPLRDDLLKEIVGRYYKHQQIAWVQEEPANAGAWSHLRPQIEMLFDKELHYVGRPAMAAAAVGSHRLHNQEQNKLISKAFSL